MKRLHILFLVLLTIVTRNSYSQHAMGLVVGDYNSPYAYSLNPALSRTNPSHRAYINWWGASVSLENNFMQYAAPFRLGAWINDSYPSDYKNINGSLSFQQDWLPVNTSVENFKLNYLAEVNGPSFFIPIDEVGTFGFGFKEVSGFSVNGLNGTLGGIMRYGLKELNKNAGKTINQGEFSLNTEKYQEWFMNFAGIAQTDNVHVWKWGTTLKFLIGQGMAHLGSDNLNFTVSSDAKSIDIKQFNGRLYRTAAGAYSTLNRPLGMSFDFAEGAGLGVDLGVVYEYRPKGSKPRLNNQWCDKESQEKYAWKFGASLTDIGFINYWGNGSQIVSTGNTSWVVDPKLIQNTQQGGDDRLNDLENRLFQDLGAESVVDLISTTPMALNLQFDQYLGGNLHLGAYWTQNLKRVNSVGLRRASYLNITPRWQTEQWEYGIPITVANDYTNLHMGIYGRLGPVIIGTDNLIGLGEYIQNTKYTGGSFYFGIRSKIGSCDKRTQRYSYIQKETWYDTIYQRDTQQIKIVQIERDTIIEKKKETTTIKEDDKPQSQIALEEQKKKYEKELNNKDQEIATLKQNAEKAQKECQDRLLLWQKDAEKCKKAQSDIEATVKKKDAEIALKEKQWEAERQRLINLLGNKSTPLPKTDTIKIDCTPELTKLKAEIEALKSQRDVVIKALEDQRKKEEAIQQKCDEERKNLQNYVDKLQAEIALLKKSRAEVEAENKILKDQVDRLSAGTLKQPCDVSLAEAQKKLAEERKKNAEISVTLEQEKAKSRNAQITAEAADKKANEAQLAVEVAKNETQKWKSAHDKLAQEKKNCDEQNKNKDIEIAALKAQLAAIKAENDALKKSANTDLSKAPVEDCTPYKAKIALLEEEISKLKSQLKSTIEASEDCTPLKTRISSLEAEIAKLKSDQSKLATEKAKVELALEEAKKSAVDVKPYQDEIAKLKAQIAVCEEAKKSAVDVKPYQDEIAKLKAQIAVCEEAKKSAVDVKSYQDEIAKLKAQITALEKASSDKVDPKPLQDEIAKLKAQIAALEKASSEKVDPKPLQDEIAKLKAQIAALEKASSDKVDPKPLQDEIAKLKAQIVACEAAKATGGDCSECEKNLTAVRASLKSAEDKVSSLEAEKKKCADDLAKLQAEIKNTEALKKENEDLKKKVSELEANIATLESTTNSTDNIDALKAEIAMLKADIAKKDNQLSGCKLQSDKCTRKLSEVEANLAKLQKEKDLCDSQYEDLKKQIITMDEDMGKLGEIIKTNNAEISKLKGEITEVRTKLKECETKLGTTTAPKEETPN